MLRLPELVAGRDRWRLPLLDCDATRLVAALLAPDGTARVTLYAQLLSSSPSFLLWTVCRCPTWQLKPPGGATDLAEWLAEHAVSALQWSQVDPSNTPFAKGDAERCAELSLRSIAVAERAGRIARANYQGDGSWRALVERVHLFGLLHAAPAWLSSCGPSVHVSQGSRGNGPLPPWLIVVLREIRRKASTSHAAIIVRQAARQVRKKLPPNSREATGESAARVKAPRADSGAERLVAASLPQLSSQLRRLEQLENEFQATLEREKLESLRQFAYGASHEINNPLANISTRAQTLLRDECEPERRKKLATINAQAFRAHEMISDMMLFAKPPPLALMQFQLANLAEEVVAELMSWAKDQGTQLVHRPASVPLAISADRVQLAAALKSLCVNSLEALGAGGIIEVRTAPSSNSSTGQGSWVEVVVEDSGPGISAEVRRHLFDPFYSGREAGRGLGLGLSKCWRIVTLHRGQIDVLSEPGQGARFTIRLPQQCVPPPEA